MRKILVAFVALLSLGPRLDADESRSAREVREVMGDFVRGWREGDTELLARVVAMDEGRITWVSGSGADEQIGSMTFRAVIDRNRVHPDYGRDGWEIVSLEIENDELAFAKLRIPEGDVVNIDYMVAYRVGGVWKIVSNTFVILEE